MFERYDNKKLFINWLSNVLKLKKFKKEFYRYITGVKGQTVESKKVFRIIKNRMNGNKITIEDRKLIVKEFYNLLKVVGIILPIQIIPLPIVSEIIIISLDYLLQKFNVYILPSSFYNQELPEIDPNEVKHEIEKNMNENFEFNEDWEDVDPNSEYEKNYKLCWFSKGLNSIYYINDINKNQPLNKNATNFCLMDDYFYHYNNKINYVDDINDINYDDIIYINSYDDSTKWKKWGQWNKYSWNNLPEKYKKLL